MNLYTKGQSLHHAYAIIGDADEIRQELQSFFKKELQFDAAGNPDFWRGEFDVMKIKDARSVIELHQSRPTAGDKKIFVVSANFITEDAQNAMLKLFEEPRGDTHFFLILPSANGLIATLRSRMIVIPYHSKASSLVDAKEFLALPIGAQMEAVKKLAESIADEEKSKIEVTKFINALEIELKKNINLRKAAEKEIKIFEQIEKVRSYAGEQSPSLKMLLEYVCFILPAKDAIL